MLTSTQIMIIVIRICQVDTLFLQRISSIWLGSWLFNDIPLDTYIIQLSASRHWSSIFSWNIHPQITSKEDHYLHNNLEAWTPLGSGVLLCQTRINVQHSDATRTTRAIKLGKVSKNKLFFLASTLLGTMSDTRMILIQHMSDNSDKCLKIFVFSLLWISLDNN